VPVLATAGAGLSTAIGDALKPRRSEQLDIGLVGALSDGDAETVGELRRDLAADRDVQRLTNREKRPRRRLVQPRRDTALYTAQVRFGRSDILLAREQQRDVDRHAGKDRRLDGRQSLCSAGNLDEEVGLPARFVEVECRRQVLFVSWASRGETFERDPAVHAIRPGEDRLEQIGGTRQIRQGQGKNRSSPVLAEDADGMSSSYMALFLIALSKIVGLDVSPVTERSSM